MDDFDNEPGTGGSYEDAFALPLYNSDTIPRRIVVRQRSGFERVSIILEEIREGITGTLIRYDDAHDRFHRHHPSWPQPADIAEFLAHIEQRQRVAYARDEIRSRYTTWEAAVFGKEPQ